MLKDEVQKSLYDFMKHCSGESRDIMFKILRDAEPALQQVFAQIVFRFIREMGRDYQDHPDNQDYVWMCKRILHDFRRSYGHELPAD